MAQARVSAINRARVFKAAMQLNLIYRRGFPAFEVRPGIGDWSFTRTLLRASAGARRGAEKAAGSIRQGISSALGGNTPPPGTTDTKVSLAILQRAMAMERLGNQFFAKAAEVTADASGQETFRQLAADETNHFDLIKRQFDSLNRSGEWQPSGGIKPPNVDLGATLFPGGAAAMEKAINVKSRDWDALLFGIDIEIKSYDFYRKAAEEIQAPTGKLTCQFLAGEESKHFEILMMRYDALYGPVTWWP